MSRTLTPATDRRRAGDPPDPLGPGPQHGQAGPRRPGARSPGRLHDGAEAAADHDGKGARRSRRTGTDAHLSRAPRRRADAAAARPGPGRPGVRRIGDEARDAGARKPARVAGGAARYPSRRSTTRKMDKEGRRWPRLRLCFGSRLRRPSDGRSCSSCGRGPLVGVLTALALLALRRGAADVRYVVGSIGLALMLTLPIASGVQKYQSLRSGDTSGETVFSNGVPAFADGSRAPFDRLALEGTARRETAFQACDGVARRLSRSGRTARLPRSDLDSRRDAA